MVRLVAALAATVAVVVLSVGLAGRAPRHPELLAVGGFSSPAFVTAPPGDGARTFVVE